MDEPTILEPDQRRELIDMIASRLDCYHEMTGVMAESVAIEIVADVIEFLSSVRRQKATAKEE